MNKYKEELRGQSRLSTPTIQFVIEIQYTKYELSRLYSCGDIFDEKWREKEKWIDIEKNKQEKAGSQSYNAKSHC